MKVLIVDDIYTNRLLLAEVLRSLEVDFDQVENGREAIDAFEASDYDLILMDIEMPVMNGIETTKYIRDKMTPPKNRVSIVALTAYNPQLFFDDFQDVGFDQLLTKPYSLDKISQLLGL
jgi:CheY-like chemotaxis protein